MFHSILLRVNAFMMLLLAIPIFLCMLMALALNEPTAFRGFFITFIVAISVGSFITLINISVPPAKLRPKTGFVIVTASWLLSSILFSFPYYFSGAIPHWADAYFETVSGFTTTGGSILPDIEALPRSILFWRSMTQWLGGIGIVILTISAMPMLGIRNMSMMQGEATGISIGKLAPRASSTAKIMWLIYLLLTIMSTFLLMLSGLGIYDALTLTFSTVSTGGFSPYNAYVPYFNTFDVEFIVIVTMLISSVNFALLYSLYNGKPQSLFHNSELRFYLAVVSFISLGIFFILMVTGTYSDWILALRQSVFQTVSLISTTGFATTDYGLWPYQAQFLLLMTFFIGGCAGSTAGGVKPIRILVMLKQTILELKYLLYPNGIFSLKINKMSVPKSTLGIVTGFITLYTLTVLVTTMLVATGGHSLETSFSAAISAIGNVGPSFGDIGAVGDFSFFQDYIKVTLSLAMIAGRLELYTTAVAVIVILSRKV